FLISATTSSAGRSSVFSPPRPTPGSLTMTLAPCSANNNATALPMPRPAPVTTAAFPFKCMLALLVNSLINFKADRAHDLDVFVDFRFEVGRHLLGVAAERLDAEGSKALAQLRRVHCFGQFRINPRDDVIGRSGGRQHRVPQHVFVAGHARFHHSG